MLFSNLDITLVNSTVSNQYPVEGNSFSLSGVVIGNIFPKVKWYRGSIQITEGLTETLIERNEQYLMFELKLVISKATKSLQGIYEMRLAFPGIPEQVLANFTPIIKCKFSGQIDTDSDWLLF